MYKPEVIEKIKKLPINPGIYKFKNARGEIIYIGKAKNLKSRVGSYFQGNLDTTSKTYALVQKISDVDYIEVQSELEALMLEAELIRKHYPKYNIALKDDKSYLYIVIRNERFKVGGKNTYIPKIITARKPDLLERDVVYGPYPDSGTAKYIVKTIRKIFPFRDCSASKFNRYKGLGKPCLYGFIGLCSAPCIGNISVEDYKKDINRIKKFLQGGSKKILNSLKKEMNRSAKKEEYEKAGVFRDMIQKFEYVSQSFRTPNKYIENPYLVDDLAAQSLDELVKNIPILRSFPKRIECYDISNISGKESVGSMVVATNGRIDKGEYRKFRIKLKDQPDDFGMMREVLERRIYNDWDKPDLIVLDGGKGQVSAVSDLFQDKGVEIPVIGLAKRFETIVYKEDQHFTEANLDKSNEGLKLLIRLRDEAHRFAQKYHHQLRLKKISKNSR